MPRELPMRVSWSRIGLFVCNYRDVGWSSDDYELRLTEPRKSGRLARWPGERASADKMDVQVEDGLACARADVEHGAVPVFDVALASDVSGGQMAASDQFSVLFLCFLQSGKMFFGNDKHVSRGLRLDVLKSEDVIVFIHFLRGNVTLNDAAKKAVGAGIGHGWGENSIFHALAKSP